MPINKGDVILLEGDWNEDYLSELKYAPNGPFMDQVDASSGAYGQLTLTREQLFRKGKPRVT